MSQNPPNPFAHNDLRELVSHREPGTTADSDRQHESAANQSQQPIEKIVETIFNKKEQEEILRNIALTGSTTLEDAKIRPVVVKDDNQNLSHVIDKHSGKFRIHSNITRKFTLILSQPQALSILNPFEIRCCVCKQVISYPCWYYVKEYSINHFHYFVCFDRDSPSKPSTACFRYQTRSY